MEQISYGTNKVEIICRMKKFDVLDIKTIIDFKNKDKENEIFL